MKIAERRSSIEFDLIVQEREKRIEGFSLFKTRCKLDNMKFDIELKIKGNRCIFECFRLGQIQSVEIWNKQAIKFVQHETKKSFIDAASIPPKVATCLVKLLK